MTLRPPCGTGAGLALTALVFGLHDFAEVGDGILALDDKIAQHGIVVTEQGSDLVENILAAFDVHQHVVGFMDFVDRVGQLAASPVFYAMDLATGFGDKL